MPLGCEGGCESKKCSGFCIGGGSDASAARKGRKQIKSRVFRGYTPGENTLLRGNGVTIPQESSPIPPAFFSQKSWGFWFIVGQVRNERPAFFSQKSWGLWGKAHDGSDASPHVTPRSPPPRLTSLRLRANPAGLCPPWALPGLGRFGDVTPRLFATAGFPPIRNKTGWLRPPGFYSSLRSIQPAHDGSDASPLSCSACSRRPASLRLRANPAGLCPPWALPFAPVHPGCSQRLRTSPQRGEFFCADVAPHRFLRERLEGRRWGLQVKKFFPKPPPSAKFSPWARDIIPSNQPQEDKPCQFTWNKPLDRCPSSSPGKLTTTEHAP